MESTVEVAALLFFCFSFVFMFVLLRVTKCSVKPVLDQTARRRKARLVLLYDTYLLCDVAFVSFVACVLYLAVLRAA